MYSNAIILIKNDFLGKAGLIESSDWLDIRCERCADQPKAKEAIEKAIERSRKKET